MEALARTAVSARLLEDLHPTPHSVSRTNRSMGNPSSKRQVDRFADTPLVLYALNQAITSTQLRAPQQLGSA
jgi:hypothetical protein